MANESEKCPFPPSGKYLESIRSSSRAIRVSSRIKIEPESIRCLLTSPAFTTTFKRVSSAHGLALPLNFPSISSELNLISVLSLLNFGSGFRVPLHRETGRGAWDNIRALVFSMYLMSSTADAGDFLSAQGMQSLTEQKVAELMRVNVHVEKPHDSIPGVTIGTLGGPMYDLVRLVTRTLNETGQILASSGYPDLGSFVIESLKEGAQAASQDAVDAEVDVILERLVRAIPAFRDMAIVNGQPVYCFKKALFLIHAIVIRFGSQPSPFPIPSTSHIPVFTDNVLPSMLVHLGVIDLSESALASLFPNVADKLPSLLLQKTPQDASAPAPIPTEGPILSTEQAYILRGSAVDACEMIIDAAHTMDLASVSSSEGVDVGWMKDMTLPELDMWIWAVAKDRCDYRQLERFVLRETIFF